VRLEDEKNMEQLRAKAMVLCDREPTHVEEARRTAARNLELKGMSPPQLQEAPGAWSQTKVRSRRNGPGPQAPGLPLFFPIFMPDNRRP
jgi:hypothetical protein